MKTEIHIKQEFDVGVQLVWKAISEKDLMAKWYFNLEEFRPEVGFIFEFISGPENGFQYNHVCEVTEVVFEKKLSYTWRYEGFEGNTLVAFELFDEDGKTRLNFTHSGLGSFPHSNPDFAISNFEAGWSYFINKALPEFLSKKINKINNI